MSENSFKVPAKTPRPVKEGDAKPAVKKASPENRGGASAKGADGSAVRKKSASSPEKPAERKKTQGAEKPETRKKTPSAGKASAPKKLKGSDLSFSKQELPPLPSLGNMTREERIAALSGGKKEKKPASAEKPKERSEITQIKESVRKNRSEKEPVAAEVHEAPPVKRDRAVYFRLGFVFLVFILIILIVVLLKKRSDRVGEIILPEAVPSASLSLSITSGMGASQVSLQLPETEREAFLSFLSDNGLASSIQTGSFSFPAGTAGDEVASAITRSEKSSAFTVYAGYTLSDIDQALSNRTLAAPGEFLKCAEEYSRTHGLSFTEGYFLAGTYTFTGCEKLLDEMHEALLNVLRDNADAVAESGLSVDDIVKTASVINRESQDAAQLKTIAAIVLNRLSLNMPLGIDATTRYETGNWSTPVPQSTYEKDTPYNTRRKPGLPPSGIGCPGEAAVTAVLYPDKTDDLYYLHDEEGKLYTSASYEEHLSTYDKVHQI